MTKKHFGSFAIVSSCLLLLATLVSILIFATTTRVIALSKGGNPQRQRWGGKNMYYGTIKPQHLYNYRAAGVILVRNITRQHQQTEEGEGLFQIRRKVQGNMSQHQGYHKTNNSNNMQRHAIQVLMCVQKNRRTGRLELSFLGGKKEGYDLGDPKRTASREFWEETGRFIPRGICNKLLILEPEKEVVATGPQQIDKGSQPQSALCHASVLNKNCCSNMNVTDSVATNGNIRIDGIRNNTLDDVIIWLGCSKYIFYVASSPNPSSCSFPHAPQTPHAVCGPPATTGTKVKPSSALLPQLLNGLPERYQNAVSTQMAIEKETQCWEHQKNKSHRDNHIKKRVYAKVKYLVWVDWEALYRVENHQQVNREKDQKEGKQHQKNRKKNKQKKRSRKRNEVNLFSFRVPYSGDNDTIVKTATNSYNKKDGKVASTSSTTIDACKRTPKAADSPSTNATKTAISSSRISNGSYRNNIAIVTKNSRRRRRRRKKGKTKTKTTTMTKPETRIKTTTFTVPLSTFAEAALSNRRFIDAVNHILSCRQKNLIFTKRRPLYTS